MLEIGSTKPRLSLSAAQQRCFADHYNPAKNVFFQLIIFSSFLQAYRLKKRNSPYQMKNHSHVRVNPQLAHLQIFTTEPDK